MPVFISYSHQDKEFAVRLAIQLTRYTNVWIDQWELQVGDSLIERIQTAIEGANALLVLLSKSSVESEWCKIELRASLHREIDEKKILVLPVLIEDCSIPLFLKDKIYADFRKNYDEGFQVLRESIARVTNLSLGRIDEPEWYTDWSFDWGLSEKGDFELEVSMVDFAKAKPFSALTTISIIGNETATKRYLKFVEENLEWIGRGTIVLATAEFLKHKEIKLVIPDERPVTFNIKYRDDNRNIEYEIRVKSRRLGEDTGRPFLLNVGGQLLGILENMRNQMPKTTHEDLVKIRAIQAYFDKPNG